MIIDEKKAAAETYAQPLLTKHDVLHALTGASGKAGDKTNCEKQQAAENCV